MGKIVNQLFMQHQQLAVHYANKIWNESNLGIEKEDLQQELRIKLFTAIKKYAEKWKEFKETGKNKPIPLKFYLKTTMINKSRDIIKEINQVNYQKISHIGYDRGMQVDNLEINRTDIKLGFENLSDLFVGEEKRVFKLMVFFNFEFNKVRKAYKGNENCATLAKSIIIKLREYLKNNNSIVKEFEIFSKD